MTQQKLFFVDAETDGLYGQFLSVAAAAVDADGTETDVFYGAVLISAEKLTSAWVKENVYPMLAQAEQFYSCEYELLEDFWRFWEKHREGSLCIADVPCPVEARLFTECVRHDLPAREFLAPFPLIDLASMLMQAGIAPLADRKQLSGLKCVQHDARNDIRMAAEIIKRFRLI